MPAILCNSRLGLWLSLLSASLISCASTAVRKEAPTPRLTVVSTRSRMLELEPCGCSARRLGGVLRESNLLTRWKEANAPILSVSSGETFIPPSATEFNQRPDFFQRKAELMVEAMNRLEVTAVSPSFHDFSLGLEQIKRLRERSKFHWVSANVFLTGTTQHVLDPFIELQYGGRTVWVTGVTKFVWQDRWPTDPRVTAESPLESLKALFSKRPEADFVILLSDLSSDERTELIREFPQIRMVIGASNQDAEGESFQQGANVLVVNPMERGWSQVGVTLQLGDSTQPFYSSKAAKKLRYERKWRMERAIVLEKRILNEKKQASREAMQTALASLKRFLRETESIPLEPGPRQLSYQAEAVALDQTLESR